MSLKSTLSIGADLAFTGVIVVFLVSGGQLVGLPVLISQELANLLAARTAIKYVRSYEEMINPSSSKNTDDQN
jgi:hypothetical protein